MKISNIIPLENYLYIFIILFNKTLKAVIVALKSSVDSCQYMNGDDCSP